jgi:hypothetical protein
LDINHEELEDKKKTTLGNQVNLLSSAPTLPVKKSASTRGINKVIKE